MSYKLPGIPSPSATACELADFIEFECLKNALDSVSFTYIQSCLDMVPDESKDADEPFEEEPQNLLEAFSEISVRKTHCGTANYPFSITERGYAVQCILPQTPEQWIYPFLLFATRLKMTRNHIHAGLDGTKLFEILAGEVLKNYWGKSRAESFVFGTASGGSFEDKIDLLCHRIGEGRCCSKDPSTRYQQDGKLDVVVWTPFTDDRSSKLIGFAQCKTGTSWHDSLSQLQPAEFCNIWFDKSPMPAPVRIFCIADREVSRWNERSKYAGLLLDRCRIADFSDNLSYEILNNIQSWTEAALDWAKSA